MVSSSEVYKTFFNATCNAVVAIEAETQTVVEANAQAINHTGYQREEILGLSVERLFRLPPGMALPFRLQEAHEASPARWERSQLVLKNGDTIEVSMNVSTVECDQARILLVVIGELDDIPAPYYGASEADRNTWRAECNFPTIIGQSEKIRQVCGLIGSVAKSDATVLIQGDSGTGKEVVANAIHAHSLRSRATFVKLNCAALTETLLESELFGHVRGAFTGAIRDYRGRFKQADGGTILLDEISSLSRSGQAKLLRVLQEHEFEPVGSSATTSVNVRVIASTNTNLEKAVAAGKFREDLFYRLNVFSIALPPLRERKEDIPLLAQHFLNKYSQDVGKKIRTLAAETLALLMEHDWPGNVRELENAIEHAVIVEKASIIRPASLPTNLCRSCEPKENAEWAVELGLRDKLNFIEKQIIIDSLIRANWIKKRAADMLRIDARNLPYLLRKHNLGEGFRPN